MPTKAVQYEVLFRRPDDCVVYAPATSRPDVSLVHRQRDGAWHCARCDSTGCRHTDAAAEAASS